MRRIILPLMIAVSFMIISTLPVLAGEVEQCDRYAASPIDIQRPKGVAGVAFNDIDAYNAKASCEAAASATTGATQARMEFQLARAYELIGPTQSRAFEMYEKSAHKQYLAAYTALGWIHYAGFYVKQDFQKAFAWYKKAADGGDPTAMNNISIMYVKGIGVARDKAKADYWYQKAIDNGLAKTDTLLRDEPEKITGFGRSYEQLSVDTASHEAKRLALQGLRKCAEGGEKEGILDESSVEYSQPVCEQITEKNQTAFGEYTVGTPTYQCTAYAYATCMHALIREENIKPKPLFSWNDYRVSYAVDLLNPNTYPRPITPESRKTARERYVQWVDELGEAKILELSEKVRNAQHDPHDSYYLVNHGATLGCGSRDAKFCLEHLLAFAKIEKLANSQDLGGLQRFASAFRQECRWPAQADVDPSDCPVVRKLRKTMKKVQKTKGLNSK